MRLQDWEIEGIKKAFQKYFLPDDHLWLFGSRANDTLKGGDIDLYVETHITDTAVILKTKRGFRGAIQDAIGEQKVDVVVKRPGYTLPIHEEALRTGVKII